MKRFATILVITLSVLLAGVLVTAQIDLNEFQPNTPISSSEVNQNFQALADAIAALQALPSVRSLNNLAGELNLVAGDNITLNVNDATGEITITSTAQGTAGGDITSVTTSTGLTGGGDSGDVTLAIAPPFRLPQACPNGSIPEWDGTAWACGTDDVGAGGGGGDITAVNAGTGLTGGGESGSVSLSVAPAFRLPDGCTQDQVAKFSTSTGLWECAADIDTDTTYTAGDGLTLNGTEFSVQFSGSGSSTAAARSDHDHLGQTWTGTDNPLILEGSYSFDPFATGEQKGAPLVLTNTDPLGYGLRITETGSNGVFVETAGAHGVSVGSAAGIGVLVGSAAGNGVHVISTGGDGVLVESAGGDGVHVSSAGVDGLRVQTTGRDGVRVDSADENGVLVESAGDNGVRVDFAVNIGVLVNSAGEEGVLVSTAGEDGVEAESASVGHYGGRFTNSASGGPGLYAEGGSDSAADITLGSVDGRIISDPLFTGSDIYLITNDAIIFQLDNDNNEPGDFVVKDSAGTNVLGLSESGNLTIAGTLTENSDIHAKTDIASADTSEILELLMGVPISTWRYQDSPDALHLGPMAQDFFAAFGLGDTDTGISTIDRDGVALAAIQGLYQLVEEKDATIAEQRQQLTEQQRLLSDQQRQLEALDDRLAALERALAQD